MAGIMIDGKAIAQESRERSGRAAAELKKSGTLPCLATVLVGDDPASATYVRLKHKACAEAGIDTRDHKLAGSISQDDLLGLVDELNSDKTVHGILVQLPLPGHIDEFAVISRISPAKDVDGLTPHNAGLLAMGKAALAPCTPLGVMEILAHQGVRLEGASVAVINRSGLVGKPLYHLLLAENATVTTCHSRTKDLAGICRQADVVITAVGDRSRFTLTADMIREGAVVIDVATTKHEGKYTGDADYDAIIEKASMATPVPGGVGPMTIAMLLKNTITAASLGSLGR